MREAFVAKRKEERQNYLRLLAVHATESDDNFEELKKMGAQPGGCDLERDAVSPTRKSQGRSGWDGGAMDIWAGWGAWWTESLSRSGGAERCFAQTNQEIGDLNEELAQLQDQIGRVNESLRKDVESAEKQRPTLLAQACLTRAHA